MFCSVAMVSLCLVSAALGDYVSVKGQVSCASASGRVYTSPMLGRRASVTVRLIDEDTLNPDDFIEEKSLSLNARGLANFHLKGYASDPIGPIEPMLRITTNCDQGMNPLYRELTFWVPEENIGKGKGEKAAFDVGNINLMVRQASESTEFID